MKIETLILGTLQTNCYLVWDEKTKKGLVIDPADEGQYIIQKIQELQISPLAIIATHGHFDHVLAATELRLTLKIPFLMHKADLFLLNSLEERSKYWTKIQSDPPLPPDKFLQDGDLIDAKNGNLNCSTRLFSKFMIHDSRFLFQVIATPGHTPGSICLYSPNNNTLFSGDTLFSRGIGRTDFSYSSSKDLRSSLKKLLSLSQKTKVFPGHGGKTTVVREENKP